MGEILYTRDFEEEPVSGTGWLVYDDSPKPELEDLWHSGYEECKCYLLNDTKDSLPYYADNPHMKGNSEPIG